MVSGVLKTLKLSASNELSKKALNFVLSDL